MKKENKRTLNDQEKKIIENRIKNLKEETEYLEEYEIKLLRFNLDIAHISYKKQISDMAKNLELKQKNLEQNRWSIEQLSKQLKEGVSNK